MLHFACRLQKVLALSSGEAELCAQSAGIADALGVRNLLEEFSIVLPIVGKCDSAAARGIVNRTGVGRMKHLELKQLWVQGYVRRKLVQVEWVPRKENPADALTHVSAELFGHMGRLQQFFPAADPEGVIASEGGVGNLIFLP